MVFRLRRRYGRRPGPAFYRTRPIRPLRGVPLSMRLAGIRRRNARLNRWRRNAPAYRRMAVARGVRNITSRYVERVRSRIRRRIATRLGKRVGVGNYIASFL